MKFFVWFIIYGFNYIIAELQLFFEFICYVFTQNGSVRFDLKKIKLDEVKAHVPCKGFSEFAIF